MWVGATAASSLPQGLPPQTGTRQRPLRQGAQTASSAPARVSAGRARTSIVSLDQPAGIDRGRRARIGSGRVMTGSWDDLGSPRRVVGAPRRSPPAALMGAIRSWISKPNRRHEACDPSQSDEFRPVIEHITSGAGTA